MPSLICVLGVRLPPAENRSMAVRPVHSENQLRPPPPYDAKGELFIRRTRPGSPAPPTTRSPRVSMRMAESPGISTRPPVDSARFEVKGSKARGSFMSRPPRIMPPTEAALSCVAPRRLTSAPCRSWFGFSEPLALPRASCELLTPPPMRTSMSPPPVSTMLPSSATRPVLPTATTSPWLRAVPLRSSMPALPPACTCTLPPPSVPKPVKPTSEGFTSAPRVPLGSTA